MKFYLNGKEFWECACEFSCRLWSLSRERSILGTLDGQIEIHLDMDAPSGRTPDVRKAMESLPA